MTAPAHPGDLLGTLTVHNPAGHRHVGYATCVLPLAQGRLPAAHGDVYPVVGDYGAGCGVPLGGFWPDGTARYLCVEVPVAVDAREEVWVSLHLGESLPVFKPHPKLAAVLNPSRMAIQLLVGEETVDLLPRVALSEQTPCSQTWVARARAENSPVWVELVATIHTGALHAAFSLQWGYSPPSDGNLHPLTRAIPPIQLRVAGAAVAIQHAPARVLSSVQDEATFSETLLLFHGGSLAAGQAPALAGTLLFWHPSVVNDVSIGDTETLMAVRESPLIVRATAATWLESAAWGPFGELIPSRTPLRDAVLADAAAQHSKLDDDPWETPARGCYPNPGRTGEQADFGVCKLRREILSGATLPLRLVHRSVLQEGCRPTHEREHDVSPVTFANHPAWLLTSGRSSEAIARGKIDHLQYAHTTPLRSMPAPSGAPWSGHDPEHWSINYLVGYALLTGDRTAVAECEHKAELWLAEFNHGPLRGRWGAPARAIGRSLAAGCWLWLVTGRADLRVAVEAHAVYFRQVWKENGGAGQPLPVVSPRVFDHMDGKRWSPWEEACAATGLLMVHHLWGTPGILGLAVTIAETVMTNGIGIVDGRVVAGYWPPVQQADGTPWSAQDPGALEDNGTGDEITGWTMPAVVIAALHGRSDAVRDRARGLLSDYTAGRDGDAGVWDWVAVSGVEALLS